MIKKITAYFKFLNLNNLAIVAMINIEIKSLIYHPLVVIYKIINAEANKSDKKSQTLKKYINFRFQIEPSGDKHKVFYY